MKNGARVIEREAKRLRRLMEMMWDVLESDENGEMDGELLWAGLGGFEFEDTRLLVVASIVFVNG